MRRRAGAVRRHPLVWLLVAVLLGVGAGVTARALDIRPVRVTTASMSPAVGRGDWIVVRDLGKDGRNEIRRGDIVLFRFPLGTSGRAIKRVIALPGDRVTVTERKVAVGRRVIPIAGAPSTTARRRRTEVVPGGHVFLLGDNAAVSIDSRSFGAVPDKEVVARELFVIDERARWLAPALVAVIVLAFGLLFVARHRR